MSSYVVLARKWRPRRFEDLIGQEHAVQALRHALEQGRIPHAFLFTGIRGIGKTTLSRLVSMCLNCTSGVTAEPCGSCDSCLAIVRGEHPDVFEVDAASRTKVDQMRELLDGVAYAPTLSRYKIYILDEVHMLSTSSFNALLKTLEEPPEHVKFIFATTEVRKILPTILSRCQRYDLRRLDREALSRYLAHVLDAEEITHDQQGLSAISHAADGSVRDALSLLDQAIAHGGGSIEHAHVSSLLGLTDRQAVVGLFTDLCGGRSLEMLERAALFHRDGVEPLVLVDDLLAVTHMATREMTVGPEDVAQALSELEGLSSIWPKLSREHLQMIYQVLLRGREDLHIAREPRQALEMLLLRAAHLRAVPPLKQLVESLQRQAGPEVAAQEESPPVKKPKAQGEGQKKITPVVQEAPPVIHSAEPEPDLPPAPPMTEEPAGQVSEPLPSQLNSWELLIEAARIKMPLLAQKMESHLSILSYEGGLGADDPPRMEVMIAHAFAGEPSRVHKSLMDLLGSLNFSNGVVKFSKSADGDRPDTEAEKQKKAKDAYQNALENEVAQDPLIQEVERVFDAKIIHVEPV
ncbi:DNA polymerase III subunit gamma/tau [Magnetococcus sp. PR-3]|uniref:DNA polymerase III subunit gamma/tau n=1 Tax=Magnetococcus sp. PR-3 TaxID=3120355 RepID=UPI002FCE4E95